MSPRLLVTALTLAMVLTACTGESDSAQPPIAPSSTSVSSSAPVAASDEPLDEPLDEQPTSESNAVSTPPVASAPITDAEVNQPSCRGEDPSALLGRTDIASSGNRIAPGSIDLLSAPVVTTQLAAPPTWIVPFVHADEPCVPHWYVTLSNGTAVIVDAGGSVTNAGSALVPPETSPGIARSAYDDLAQFDNPLPDSRVVSFGRWTAALVDPTERYPHGVLGDRIEAGAIQVIDTTTGDSTRIVIDAPSVIEGISPMLIDVDQANDAVPEILVTLSNSDDGAWLALYNIDGTLRARSEPIGQGNRWRNQLGAGSIGTDSSFEIVDVRTPHLSGDVEFFRVRGDQLERTASLSGYTSHVIGSQNLDMGILVDADADKVVEVLLPTRDRTALAILDRVDDQAVELGRITLNGSLNTNIASQWLDGQALIAVGTQDGRLLVLAPNPIAIAGPATAAPGPCSTPTEADRSLPCPRLDRYQRLGPAPGQRECVRRDICGVRQ